MKIVVLAINGKQVTKTEHVVLQKEIQNILMLNKAIDAVPAFTNSENGENTYFCEFTPTKSGSYMISLIGRDPDSYMWAGIDLKS